MTFYITTAIDYPNGRPHMGHAYEKIISDFYARFYKQYQGSSYFLTGTDENGQKLIKSAQAANKQTLDFVDDNVAIFKELCSRLKITNDDFIRTTEKRHFDFVQRSWSTLEEKGFIYKGNYSGWYCYDCENFYNTTSMEEKVCPEHSKPLEMVEEEGFFFKLSEFHDKIVNHIKSHPDFIVPSSSRKEILARLEDSKLKDIAISRPSEGWGVPVPSQSKYVVYTWFDALMNYVSALTDDQKKQLWPASAHVIGKDIAWFHTVIWPSILMGLGLELPKTVYVHGMVLDAQGRKMSKSLGNGIDPMELMDKYPIESFKFYTLYGLPAQGDGSFSEQDLINTHNTTLANDFGNLIMRVIKLALKKLESSTIENENFQRAMNFATFDERYQNHVKAFEHNKALTVIRDYVQDMNQYVNDQAPWQYKEEAQLLQFKEIIYNCVYAIHCVAYAYRPAMPEISAQVLDYINPSEDKPSFGLKYELKKPEILFTKIEAN